jgi:hypothetical protein
VRDTAFSRAGGETFSSLRFTMNGGKIELWNVKVTCDQIVLDLF